MIGLGLDGYDPDSGHESALAFRIQVVEDEQFIPRHQHRKGQPDPRLAWSAHLRGGERYVDGAAAVRGVGTGSDAPQQPRHAGGANQFSVY
ncbi:Uncharacterised protein [Raoultella planticola]|nr:Uncharacterised protein [Raoultella planticola]